MLTAAAAKSHRITVRLSDSGGHPFGRLHFIKRKISTAYPRSRSADERHLPPSRKPAGPIPADDPGRVLTHVNPDTDESLLHLGVVGDTYTILVSGADTAGRYTLIDMHVPPGGGPPPHRHDFEEMFTVLDGEIELTSAASAPLRAQARRSMCRPTPRTSSATPSDRPARLLCLCSPAGQEEFFKEVGVPVAHRTKAPPALDGAATAAFIAKAVALAPKYRTELLLDDPKP